MLLPEYISLNVASSGLFVLIILNVPFLTISSILKNVSSYFGLDFKIPEIASGNFFLYDNSQHKELCSEAEMNTLLLHSEDVNFSLVVWDDEKHTIYIVEYRI